MEMNKNKKTTIGVWCYEEPFRIKRTLKSLRMYTSEPFKLVLMADGMDAAMYSSLSDLGDIPKLATDKYFGAPACFNRLITYDNADIVVFLESGCIVTPAWLTLLLEALNTNYNYGLAGPSTNMAWNDQKLSDAPDAKSKTQTVEAYALRVAQRYKGVYGSLDRLYSLADFCYVVKRDVIKKIGRADIKYGMGPCWEMDYNIRAARAGFKGVWVCGAYVHRLPVTARRKREEGRFIEHSKRRYQDKFCLLKLKNKRGEYCRHCVGDTCKYFAPRDLIQIWLSLTEDGSKETHKIKVNEYPEGTKLSHDCFKSPISKQNIEIKVLPFVSCIMPTHNRRSFVPQAIKYFLNQDYPERELIIVDDGTDPVRDLLPDDPRIRYLYLEQKSTLGAKRNVACNEARGKVIVHWDDDDWMAPWRIRYQVESLLKEQADICGLNRLFFYDPVSRQSWQYVYSDEKRPWVAGGTLCYKRAFWNKNPFPHTNFGEDTQFLWSRHPSRKVLNLQDNTFYIALVHSGNTSPKRTAFNCWHSYPINGIQKLMGDDWEFYVNIFQPKNKRGDCCQNTHENLTYDFPLVSCIMPTYERRFFAPQAIKYFLRQDYPNKELVIVDDGTDKLTELIPTGKEIKYIHLERKASIGYKRNIAAENARGQIIAHWDDDDWYHPTYLKKLIHMLLQSGERKAIAGLGVYLIYILEDSILKICRTGGIAGATFCYFKTLWEMNPYRDVNNGEDFFFLQDVKPFYIRLENPELFIVIRHKYNTWTHEKGININRFFYRLGNYSKGLNEVVEKDDHRFFELAKHKLFMSSY